MTHKEYKFKSCEMSVYTKYIVAKANPGVDIYKTEVDALNSVVSENFDGDFGLIEVRGSETSINPLAYVYAKGLMPRFKAFALVTESELTKKSFYMEQMFMDDFQIKSAIFATLEQAEKWIKNEI